MLFSFWVIDVKRSPKVEKRIKERVALDLCLMVFDDGRECTNPMHSGGQCVSCANAFQYELVKLSTQKAKNKLRSAFIARGWRLPSQEQRKLRRILKSTVAKVAADCVEVA